MVVSCTEEAGAEQEIEAPGIEEPSDSVEVPPIVANVRTGNAPH